MKAVNDQPGTIVALIFYAEYGCSFGRGHGYLGMMVGQIHGIAIGAGFFCLMRKPTGPAIFIPPHFAAHRHQAKAAIVVYPGRWLVGLFKSSYFIRCIAVHPTVTIFAGLGAPGVHAPGQGYGWVSIPCGKCVGALGTHQGINIIRQIGGLAKGRLQ